MLNKYKFKHFFFNKYVLSLFKRKRFHLTYDYEHKALWYRTYKVGSRTIDSALKQNSGKGKYIYASEMSYVPSMFKNYFKFCFIRNPESRFISAWKDKVLRSNYFNFDSTTHDKMKDLNNFISWVETMDIDKCDEHLRSQNSLIDLNNVDFIGRLENFNDDFEQVLEKLGITNFEIEHRNAGIKKETKLTTEQRQRIHQLYKKDFQLFYPQNT